MALIESIYAPLIEGPQGPEYPVLNGVNQYITIPVWSGVSAGAYVEHETDNDDGFVVNSTQPITEIGRVGASYHSGNIKSVRPREPSPLQGVRAMASSAARAARLSLPQLPAGSTFTFWYAAQSAVGDQVLCGATEAASLVTHTDADTLTFTADVTVKVDGVAVTSGSKSLTAGRHYEITLTLVNPLTITHVGTNTSDVSGIQGGVVGAIKATNGSTGKHYPYQNRNDSGNVLENINPATAEGPELYDFTNVGTSGAGIIEQTRTGYYFDGSNDIPQASERSYINLPATEAGKHYQITGRLRVASPTAGSDLTIFARDGQNGDGTILASVGVDVNTREEFRLVFAASGVASTLLFDGQGGVEQYWVDNISIKEVTHGIWYENGVAMTPAAADAARTFLPMISRHYPMHTPGRVQDVLGGTADGTLVGLTAADWQPV